jgi:hypothetical protein
MAGPVPAIHVFLADLKQDVDARPKAGHDELEEVTVSRQGTEKQHRKARMDTASRCRGAIAPGFCVEDAPFEVKRAQGMPGAGRTRRLVG